MKTRAVAVEKFVPQSMLLLPLGTYSGTGGGYEVQVIIHGEQYRFRTEDGIRTPNAKCAVRVTNDGVFVDYE